MHAARTGQGSERGRKESQEVPGARWGHGVGEGEDKGGQLREMLAASYALFKESSFKEESDAGQPGPALV